MSVSGDVFGAPVRNVTWTFNGSTAMPFAGLAPGASFTCSAPRSASPAVARTARIALTGGRACVAVPALAPRATATRTLTTTIAATATGSITHHATAQAANAPRVRARATVRVQAATPARVTPAATD